jgi:diguanylate cyclase (GGDEF)-like protein
VEREINFPDLKILNKKLLQSERELLDSISELKLAQSHSVFRNKSLELISRGYPLFEVLNSIALEIEHQNPKLTAAIMVLDHSGNQLCVGAAPSLPDFFVDAIQAINIAEGESACAKAARDGKAVISRNMLPELNGDNLKAIAERAGITSTWAEPIKSADGTILGILSLYRRDLQSPEESDLRLIDQSTNLISIATERNQADRQIWRQANYDSLTRLPNRNLFHERLKQEILSSQRNQQSMALLFIDLDHFKEVNDSLGHIKGDDLLVQTATRLSNCVRQIDTVARLGGDEFTIVMGELDSHESVERVAEKVISVLSEKFVLDRDSAQLSASIGIAFYPDHGEDSDSLIRCADRAMYIAKNRGRNRFCIYTG